MMKIPHALIPPQSLLFYSLFTVLFCTLDSTCAIELFSRKQEEEQDKKKQEKNKNQRRLNPLLPKSLC